MHSTTTYTYDSDGKLIKTVKVGGYADTITEQYHYLSLADYRKLGLAGDTGSDGDDKYLGSASCYDCSMEGLSSCKGHDCVGCEGKGKIECKGCGGDGYTKNFITGKESICRYCIKGYKECKVCEGEGKLFK